MPVPRKLSRIPLLPALALLAIGSSPTAGQVGSARGTVRGTVYDSIEGTPLQDAAVFLWNTPHRAETDAEGRFVIEGVPAGSYSILFFHTRLGELGVSPGPRTLSLAEGVTEEVHLATPSLPTLIQTQCLTESRSEVAAGALAGRVVDAESQLPLVGARVELSWNEEDRAPPRMLELTTGPDGRYSSCAVPADIPILISASYFDRGNSRVEVAVPKGGVERVDLPLYDFDPTRVSGHLVDDETGKAIEGAETWLRGTSFRELSDGSGHFDFDGVLPGTYMLMTDHLAYGTKMDTLAVGSGQSLTVEMRLGNRPIEIAPIVVTAEMGSGEIARRRGGIVITREQIDRLAQRSRDASDVVRYLQIPGMIVRHNSNGTICVGFSTGQVRLLQTDCDEMLIYINDVRATNTDLALRLPPDAIERMVIYKPVEAGNLFGLGGGNGVWVIYTRGNRGP
jgi:hypothetical protein